MPDFLDALDEELDGDGWPITEDTQVAIHVALGKHHISSEE